ncbi:MAG: hypothetical protein M3Y08_01375 [Fibrobacterota bacterium]|nr:hypothetical protein [Fibrobacterota bacterium]
MLDFLTGRGWQVEISPQLITLYHKGSDIIDTYPTLEAAYKAMGGLPCA